MTLQTTAVRCAAVLAAVVLASSAASAGCVNKAAKATAGSKESAKWFVMETMVQDVSWGLWPGWLATGKVDGYRVSRERYKCRPEGSMVHCHGRATFCKR